MSNAHASRLSMLMGIAMLLTDCFAKGVTEEFESNPLSAAGAGDLWMESVLGKMSSMLPGQAVGLPHFSEEAAHLLLAAADYLLVPSRFEPSLWSSAYCNPCWGYARHCDAQGLVTQMPCSVCIVEVALN